MKEINTGFAQHTKGRICMQKRFHSLLPRLKGQEYRLQDCQSPAKRDWLLRPQSRKARRQCRWRGTVEKADILGRWGRYVLSWWYKIQPVGNQWCFRRIQLYALQCAVQDILWQLPGGWDLCQKGRKDMQIQLQSKSSFLYKLYKF